MTYRTNDSAQGDKPTITAATGVMGVARARVTWTADAEAALTGWHVTVYDTLGNVEVGAADVEATARVADLDIPPGPLLAGHQYRAPLTARTDPAAPR